jgi:hypothetical protein
MPRTLPINRSRGRTVDSTTSTTRLCFSSTPGQDREPEAEDTDEDEHRADVRDEEPCLVILGLRFARADRRGLLRRGEGVLVDIACAQDRLDTHGDDGRRDDLGRGLVGLLVEADLARPGQVGRHGDDDIDRASAEGRIGGRGVGVGGDLDRPVELPGRRRDRHRQRGRCGLDDPDLRRRILAEQQGRQHEQPTTMIVVNATLG